jgi:hypothetical protein
MSRSAIEPYACALPSDEPSIRRTIHRVPSLMLGNEVEVAVFGQEGHEPVDDVEIGYVF